MENDVGRRMADHFAGDGGIGIQRQRRQPARPQCARQYAALNNMQRMQFQARHALRHDLIKGVEARRRVFAGQTDNKMRANFQPTRLRLRDGALI